MTLPSVRMLALAGLLATSAPALAQEYEAMSCPQLWYERNAIYKAHGYCFQTERGIRTFGNEGCFTSNERDLGLSPVARRRVALITEIEREKGCR
jgi:hypothetical protein